VSKFANFPSSYPQHADVLDVLDVHGALSTFATCNFWSRQLVGKVEAEIRNASFQPVQQTTDYNAGKQTDINANFKGNLAKQ